MFLINFPLYLFRGPLVYQVSYCQMLPSPIKSTATTTTKCTTLHGFGERCFKIRDVCMDFEPCFKLHNSKCIILGQITNLNMIFHVVLEFIDWLKFETRPSSQLNFATQHLPNRTDMEGHHLIFKMAGSWVFTRLLDDLN